MTYLLLPAGGAAGPRISTTENILIPVSVFDAQRQKQNESSGVKKFRQCTSCGCSSHHPAALYWFSSSAQLCSRMDVCRRSCGWTQPSVFCVPPSWCEGTAHTWNICLILHSSSKEFDICLMSLFFSLSKHCPSSLLLVFFFFFLFPHGSLLNLNDLPLFFVLLPSSIPEEEFWKKMFLFN